MRDLAISLLALLLSGCAVTMAAPAPPSREHSELLYRTLALQAMTHKALLQAARGEISDTDGLATVLFVAAALEACAEALQREYPAVLHKYATIADAQNEALARISQQWIVARELSPAAAADALAIIAAETKLRRYTDHLLSLGYSHDDIEMMETRLRAELAKLAAP